MRFREFFAALALFLLVSGCKAGPLECSTDADCGEARFCDHTLNGVKGFCRNEDERPPPGEDGGEMTPEDGGPAGDGGVAQSVDASAVDGGSRDGGAVDGGSLDGGAVDGGTFDGGAAQDGGVPPADGGVDAGLADAGVLDADSDSVLDDADNCPSAFNPLQEDQDRDGVGDACDVCPTISNSRGANGVQDPLPCAPRAEVEPNDLAQSAPAATVPGVFTGAIDPPGDIDAFVFAAEPGAHLRVDVETAGGDLNAAIALVGLDATNASYARVFDDPSRRALTRDVFLGAGGRYALAVTDARNALWNVGGPTFTYRITVSTLFLPSDAPRITVLPTTRSDSLSPAGSLRMYTLGAAVSAPVRVEVSALRSGASDLDAAVTVYDPAARKILGVGVDQDHVTADPRVIATLPAGRELLVVVEPEAFYSSRGIVPRTSYTIDFAAAPSGVELEPNESAATAIPLRAGMPIAGTIDFTASTGGPQLGDRDVFRFDGTIGSIGRVAVQGTSASLQATLEVRDPSGARVAFHRDPSRSDAVAEVLMTSAGEYTVWVDDRRNADARNAGSGAFVGGPSFGFTLTLESFVVTPAGLGPTPTAADVPAGGSAFFELTPGTSGSLVVRCENGSTGFSPWLRLYERAAWTLVAEGPSPLEHWVGPNPFVVAVSDAQGRGGGGARCDASASVTMTIGASSVEPANDSRATATPLAPPAAHALASLASPSDVDWYRIAAPFPSTVSAYLQGPLAARASLRLIGSDGRPIADAAVATQDPALGKLVLAPHGPLLASDLFFEVRSAEGATGSYTLVVRAESTCAPVAGAVRPAGADTNPPPFAERTLLLSEVLPAPVGDVNGDGVPGSSEDELVEVYNPSASATLDLGGVTISDASQHGFTFPCRTLLAPRTAAVVFGGGRPHGDFGGSQVFASKESSRQETLSLNNDADTVTLADATGKILDRFTWATMSTCGNASCALDLDAGGQTLVKHTTIAGASGTSSPGRKPSGALFDGAATPPSGDLCAGAPAIPVDLSQPTVMAIDARAATDNYAASCGLPGRDVVFTLSPAAPVSVDFFPSSGIRAVSVRDACNRDAVELTGACAAGPLSLDALSAGTYGVFVEADGQANLRVEVGTPRTPAANLDCLTGIDLSTTGSGATHRGNTRAGGRAYDSACTPERDEEPGLWYQFTLAARARVRITVAASWAPIVTLLGGCDGAVIACGAPSIDLPDFAPGTYRFAVSGRGARDGNSGSYDVVLSLETAVPPPARDQAVGAPSLISGTLSGESTIGAAHNYTPPPSGPCASLPGMLAPDVVYPIALAAGKSLNVVATPRDGSGLDLALYLLDSVADLGACLAAANAAGPELAESLVYTNGSEAGIVWLVVDAASSGARGLFDLEVQIQ